MIHALQFGDDGPVNFKYAAMLKERPDQPCPGDRFAPQERKAFRFLRKPATDADFEVNPDVATPTAKCSAYALSMFASIEQAQAKYASLASAHDDDGETAIKRYGDHVGELQIAVTDGVSDSPARSGHFGLHPAAGVSLSTRVTAYTPCEYLEQLKARRAGPK